MTIANREFATDHLSPQPLFRDQSPLALLREMAAQFRPESPTTSNKTSSVNGWDHRHYFERFTTDPAYASPETRNAMLREDLYQLLLEVNLIQAVTRYDYWIEIPTNSMERGGYLEDMDAMTHNFIRELAKQDKSINRALIEYIVFENAKQFFIDHVTRSTDPNTDTADEYHTNPALLITSPPDLKDRGYHGSTGLASNNWQKQEDHHTFFYLMECSDIEWNAPTSGTGASSQPLRLKISTTQYRTWHSIQQLLDTHHSWGAPIENPTRNSVTAALFANVLQFNIPLGERDVFIDQLESHLYADQTTWKHSPDEAPIFPDGEDVEAEAMALYDQFFLPLALDIFSRADAEMVENDTAQYHQLLAEFDLLTNYFLRAVEQRIHELNTNPHYSDKISALNAPTWLQGWKQKIQNWHQKLFAPQTTSQTEEVRFPVGSQNLVDRIPTLRNLYLLDRGVKIYGQKLSKQEREFVLTQLPQVLELGNFAFGSAQCLVLSPFTAPLSAMKMVGMGSMGGGGLSASLGKFEGALNGLSLQGKESLYHELVSQNYQPKEFSINGQTVTYMVPASYGDECYVRDGIVFGPCDIPLEDDPLAFPMTAEEFSEYLETLRQSIIQEEAAPIYETIARSDLSPAEKVAATQRYDQKLKQLFKPVVGFVEVINDDVQLAAPKPNLSHFNRAFLQNLAAPSSLAS